MKLKTDLKLKDDTVINKGTEINLIKYINEGRTALLEIPSLKHKHIKINCHKLHYYFPDFNWPPNMEELEEWLNDCYCESIRGEKTEPDGYDTTGAPSWLLAFGLI